MKKIFPTLLYLSVFGLMVFLVFNTLNLSKDLKNGELIENVIVLKADANSKFSRTDLSCSILWNGERKNVVTSSPLSFFYSRYLVNRSFPAMYSKKCNKIDLLILPEDFTKYGLPYPDSLHWVDSLIRSQ